MIHVLLVDEVRAVREMSIAALRQEPDLEVRGQAATLEQMQSQIAWCDVAVVNAGAEAESALQAIGLIHKTSSQAKIVVIGLVGNHSFLLRCLEAGINGYLLQDATLNDMLRTIRAVQGDAGFMTSPRAEATASIDDRPAYGNGLPQMRLGLLTRREREVLSLMQNGQTNKEIAETLVVELGTVKNHVHSILHKLNMTSRRETLYLPQPQGGWNWAQPQPTPAQETYAFAQPARLAVAETTASYK